ncbi:MAG TPA: protein kinase, partial [Gemmataceae bacterium]|nr:protein kinase [Gemmataceae bacterium]
MASPNAENQRDLLLAHLALELNFISPETLAAAKKVWNFDKSRPMGLILVERQAISPHTRDVLENLVQLQLVQDGSEQDPTPPVNADATDFGDVEILSPPEGPTDGPLKPDNLASLRFRKLKPHAAGALGQVYLARDKELHRKVALKEIKELYADNPDARSRFLLEAEITGRLEHPGVVPVYGLGTYASGRPFYAMRFIKGESLEEAIRRLHAQDSTRTPADQAMELRRLLTRFVGVCNTMQYAHDRDIVHRDLKPSNIMLGTYGETLVVDWGLAKVMGKVTGDASGSVFEPLLSSGSSSDTLPGRAIGTITYMSPEQAAGRVDQIGPVSDVYCLGATLFALLTGRPSVEDSTAADPKRADLRKIQAKVVSGEIHRVRDFKPGIDRALEAICMKCLALQQARRYQSAREIADDLERWLGNEPVSAYPEPITVRTRRWVSRHRTLVTTGAVAILVGLVFSVAQVALLKEANDELTIKENEAQIARKSAVDANEGLVAQKEIADKARNNAEQEKTRADEEKTRAIKAKNDAVLARDDAKKAQIAAEEATRRAEDASALNTTMLAQSRWNEGQPLLANEILEQIPAKYRHGGWHFLRRQFEGSYATLYGHIDAVRSVSYSPDGKLLASLDHVGAVKVWDAHTGQNLATLKDVTAFALSPDNQTLVTGAKDGVIKSWDARKGGLLLTSPKLHEEAVTSLAFSPDGKQLASAGQDGKILWCDPATLKNPTPLKKGHSSGVTGLVFSPDGKRLASTGLDKSVIIWDLANGEPAQTYLRSTNGVAGIAYSPDGKYFATAGMDESVKVWKADSGEEVAVTKGRHAKGITAIGFSPDGTQLASAGWDGTVLVWGVVDGKELATLRGHAREVLGFCFSPDGQRLASASGDCTVKLWELLSGQEMQSYAAPLKAIAEVAFDPTDNQRVVSGGWNGSVKVWNLATGASAWDVPKAHANEVLAV